MKERKTVTKFISTKTRTNTKYPRKTKKPLAYNKNPIQPSKQTQKKKRNSKI